MRRLMVSLAVAGMIALVAGSVLAADAKKPDATLKLSEGSVAAGIGWSWGHGTLTYMGKTHKFKVEGLSVGEVGMTKAVATGKVYNLKKLEDFDGVYGAGGAAATAGQGAGITALVNPNGVQVVLHSDTKGASLKLAAEGIKFKLEN
jgi:opacity protein-like surface antigen